MNLHELNESLKLFLEDTRAERNRLNERAKATNKVADRAWKLQIAIDKLERLEQEVKRDDQG